MTDPIESLARFLAPDRTAPWWIAVCERDVLTSVEPNTGYILDHMEEIEARLNDEQAAKHRMNQRECRLQSLAGLLTSEGSMNTLNLLFTLILLCLVAAVLPMHAQPSIYVGGGPSLQADLPHGALNATVGICNSDVTTCAVLNYAARGTLDDFRKYTLIYSTSAGVRQVIASAGDRTRIDLFALGNAGASIAVTSTGFSGAAGGGLTIHPGKMPNWGVSGAAQGEYSPTNPGWRPNLFLQVGYVFRSSK